MSRKTCKTLYIRFTRANGVRSPTLGEESATILTVRPAKPVKRGLHDPQLHAVKGHRSGLTVNLTKRCLC